VKLNDRARDQIIAMVNTYFEHEPFGRSAPFADPAVDWLQGIETAARHLVASYSSRSGAGGIKVHFSNNINNFMPTAREGGPGLREFVRQAYEVMMAARLAREEVQVSPGFHERAAWRAMIVRLWKFAYSEGFPTTVNNSGIKKSKENGIEEWTSPFVAFVRELQRSFPGGLAQFTHSDGGLAGAIIEATRAAREFEKTKPA
jgi:hypothetical protein